MRLRRSLLAAALVALTINCGQGKDVASNSSAILNGTEDVRSFPQVCTITWSDPNDPSLPRYSMCSGSLLTPTVMLTAGHCSFREQYGFAINPMISCDPVFIPGISPEHSGRLIHIPVMDPDNNVWDPDVGVFILDEPLEISRYASLPPHEGFDADVFDHVAEGRQPKLTAVGYGLTADPSQPTGTRRVELASYGTMDDYFLHISNVANMGDSGGPAFLASSRTVLAIAIGPCTDGLDCYGRMDRADVLAFLHQYVP